MSAPAPPLAPAALSAPTAPSSPAVALAGSSTGKLPVTAEPFRLFVDVDAGEIDLIDSVAYALYKQRKLEFVRSFNSTHGRAPTTQEVENFILGATLPASIEAFRTAATEALREFSEEVLTAAEAEVEQRYHSQLVAELKKARPFVKTLGENILANLGALAVIALILLVIYGSRIDGISLLGDVFGYDIKERPAVPASGPR